MQSVMIQKLCTPCCLKWLRMMKLPIQMIKSPFRSLFQKILTTKPILTHMIGLDMTKKMLRTWSEINIWLACIRDKMLKKLCFKVLKLFQRQPNGTLICLKSKAPISATTSRYYFKIAIPFLLKKMILGTFQAKMLHAFGHATLFSHASDTICSQDKESLCFCHATLFSHAPDTLCS